MPHPLERPPEEDRYRGRIAPSPTGDLHLGHAQTFWIAAERARGKGGDVLLRIDDLDQARCRPHFVETIIEDLAWLGIRWILPTLSQSERIATYRAALDRLHAAGLIYPCHRSRRDVIEAIGAPHEPAAAEDQEPIYPTAFRPPPGSPLPPLETKIMANWRFRVPDGATIEFHDGNLGYQRAVAGEDFGDFLVWRKDDLPSYQLASVVDDALLGITEVVRGADLVQSTFRQILLFEALGWALPTFFHCPLVTDPNGVRLAKRHDALSLRALRAAGRNPSDLIAGFHRSLKPAPSVLAKHPEPLQP